MHAALYDKIGKSVTLHVNTRYGIPDTVEVYHEGQWLCRAYAQNTEEGREFSSEGLGLMQQRQMAHADRKLQKQNMMQSVDGLLASQQANHSTPSHVPNVSRRDPVSVKQTYRLIMFYLCQSRNRQSRRAICWIL